MLNRHKPHIQRRTFLQGAGALMALPALEAMLPAAEKSRDATLAKQPVRQAYIFFANGAIMPDWKPKTAGADYELSKTIKSIEKHRDDFLVFTGLAQDNGRAKGDGPGDHARCASTYLTGAHPKKTSGADIHVGISVDQLAAKHVGKETRLPSLELGIERGRTAGNCDSGYSCAYSSAISWRTATTPMAKEINPRAVFERLFGVDDGSAERRAKKALYRKSILDLVANDASKLKTKLGKTDRQKIDEYFASVRELETRIEQAEQAAEQQRPDIEVPEGTPGDLVAHIRLMYDLMALAFQTDTTRITTFMLGNAGSNRAYKMVGVNGGHHHLSHHRDDSAKVADLQKVDEFLLTQFGYFLEKLKEIKEPNGSLLDNSMIVYGSGLGDGNRHRHDDLPIILAGRGGGTIDPGRHIKFQHETPLNNLFMSMLERAGMDVPEFGDANGRIKELKV
ncbi:MAG: hypothetical protein CMJ78_10320 [Planctomycetaceae bacterium]|nr:hypothetical protein [Planctomycetaceae bacterium]